MLSKAVCGLYVTSRYQENKQIFYPFICVFHISLIGNLHIKYHGRWQQLVWRTVFLDWSIGHSSSYVYFIVYP